MAVTSPYLTRQEFFDLAIGGAAFRTQPVTTVDASLQAASDMADGYFRKRFTYPLQSIGSDVKRTVAAIACFDLVSHRGFRPDSGTDDVIIKRYDDAMSWLLNVSKGLIEPDIVDATDTDEMGSLAASSPTPNLSWNMGPRCKNWPNE